jgi:ribosomal protein S18 acetylase RimI-like enzyme
MLWVAADDADQPVGFLAAQVLDGTFHIAELSVAAACQRQGIGARLVETAIRHGRELRMRAITLSTYRDVKWNGPFYARLGFSETDPGAVGPGHLGKQREEAEAGHDSARRCIMWMRLD